MRDIRLMLLFCCGFLFCTTRICDAQYMPGWAALTRAEWKNKFAKATGWNKEPDLAISIVSFPRSLGEQYSSRLESSTMQPGGVIVAVYNTYFLCTDGFIKVTTSQAIVPASSNMVVRRIRDMTFREYNPNFSPNQVTH